jgi:hypothetical protein
MTRASCPHRNAVLRLEALESRATPAIMLGLTTANSLITFDSAAPTKIVRTVKVNGLASGEDLVTLDARPAGGQVFGLTNRNTLYTLNVTTGAATRVGSGPAAFNVTGAPAGMDFSPTVDRIRVVTAGDLNYRVNPTTGSILDGDAITPGTQPDTAIAFAVGDPNAGQNPNVTAIAYDRNFLGTGLTTLFGIDTTRDALVRIGGVDGTPSPNAGQVNTVGSLGVAVGGRVGFDITADGTAYAAMTSGGLTRLYTVNLTTGQATPAGKVGTGLLVLDALTALPRQEIVYGMTPSNRLVSFLAADPGRMRSAVPLRNLIAGESVSAIDFRPASGELFAFTSFNRILRVHPATGDTMQLGVPIDFALFQASQTTGFDFNPAADRLRLVNLPDDNLRYNPFTLSPVTPADTNLAYIATDPNVGLSPDVVAVAYDRNDNNPATATTLFGIDSGQNTLVRQGAVDGNAADIAGGGSPNGGLLTTIGGLGVNPLTAVGFDISDAGSSGSGAALAVMQLQGETVSKLFQINLATGAATLIGTVGTGEVLSAMAIAPPTVQFAAPTFKKGEGGGTATVTITRTGGEGSVVTVRFDTLDGTAIGGRDYTAVQNFAVTFQRGETQKTVTVPLLNDAVREPTETVLLTLSVVSGGAATLGVDATSILNILNDD